MCGLMSSSTLNGSTSDPEPSASTHQVAQRPSRFRQLLRLVRPYRFTLMQCLAIMLLLSGLNMFYPLLFAEIIGRALPNQDMELFMSCLIGMLSIRMIGEGLGLWNGHLLRLVGGRVIFSLRKKMYDHVQKLSLGFFESRSPGEINARLMGDTASLTNLQLSQAQLLG